MEFLLDILVAMHVTWCGDKRCYGEEIFLFMRTMKTKIIHRIVSKFRIIPMKPHS